MNPSLIWRVFAMPHVSIEFDGVIFSAQVQHNRIAENPVDGLLCPNCKQPLQRVSMQGVNALQGKVASRPCCGQPIKRFSSAEELAAWESRGWEQLAK
jgi:hypothetical protein